MELIPIDKELSDFKSHLEINERTIFSAKFGDGKTFFLNEFKKLYKDDYYFITLYPINYSIADNQDIFEYIKRDILFQLAKDGKLNPIDFEGIANSIFTLENIKEVISFLISCLPKGEILNKILEKGETFAKKYKEEQTTFKKYESWFTAQKGGLYEHDGYTQLIIETLKYIKSSGYKTVLIIEDLDRIDPAHLFRILNVLGAHIDEHIYKESVNTNKFGFDNIITVFDYNKTENIFHHFYGQNANYDGYINKFISHQPFFYSIDEIAREYLYSFISNKCRIAKDSLRKFSKSLNERLDSLSVRNVKYILEGAECYIREKPCETYKRVFIPKSSLTYTIYIFKLIGISYTDIKRFISSLSTLELLNCINVFLYTCVDGTFKFGENKYTILIDSMSKEHIINKITVINNDKTYTSDDLNEVEIDKCIDEAFKFIRK